jgi:ankyrin repeat protein
VNVAHANEKSWTALMFAARNGHLEIVEKLLEHDSKTLTQTDTNGITALIHAMKK